MRLLALAALLGTGCIGGAIVVHGESGPSDDRLMRQVMRQDLWAQQALDARPNDKQLARIRAGDAGAVGRAHKELVRLTQAIDRATWIRENVAGLMREDNDPRLAQEFDRAGRLRAQAAGAIGQLGNALADGGALTTADLVPAIEAQRKAQASEARFARWPRGPNEPVLAPAPLASPSPIDAALARVGTQGAPEAQAQAMPPPQEVPQAQPGDPMPPLPPDAHPSPQDLARQHAAAADLDRQNESQQHETEAPAPQSTLTIQGDALELITRKRPRSITLREDGLFDLSCADGEYLVSPDGKLVRKDPPALP